MSSVSTAYSPLMTTFIPPAWCLDDLQVAQVGGSTLFGLGTPCGVLNESCYPAQVAQGAPASVADLTPLFYTPGVYCPSGYTTATTTTIAATVTGAACCPSGLAPSGTVCIGLPIAPFTATGCDSATTVFSDPATTYTASAALVLIAFESSDVASAAAMASTASAIAASETSALASSAAETSSATTDSSIGTRATQTISYSNQTVAASGGVFPTQSGLSNATMVGTSGASQVRMGWSALAVIGLAAAAIFA